MGRGVGMGRGQISNTCMGSGAGALQPKIVNATAMTGCCSAQMRRTYSMLLAEMLSSKEYESSGAKSSHSVPCERCLAKAEEIWSLLQQHSAVNSYTHVWG